MTFAFLACFIGGLLLGVRIMFYGAERHHRASGSAVPLRRWELSVVSFLVMFGIVGYLLTRHATGGEVRGTLAGAGAGIIFAGAVTWLAMLTARVTPEHDPDDPRFLLQGRVGIVTVAIPAGGEGMIRYEEERSTSIVRARNISAGSIDAGEEVCIERVEDGVAHVELWRLVEERL
jgi:membrane protein implicated in regulation of membrane protease activity